MPARMRSDAQRPITAISSSAIVPSYPSASISPLRFGAAAARAAISEGMIAASSLT